MFGTLLFQAREQVDMPLPATSGPHDFVQTLRDLIWEWLYEPIGKCVGFIATYANRSQLLTIRQYLGLVFIALVSLLSLLAF